MANPLRRMVSSSQVSDWSGQGQGTIVIPSRISAIKVNMLVIAGGGGSSGGTSGISWGPGGGASQISFVSNQDLIIGNSYTIIVGAGGNGTVLSGVNGSPGSYSLINFGLTSLITAAPGKGGVAPRTGGDAGETYTGGTAASGAASGGGAGSAANGGNPPSGTQGGVGGIGNSTYSSYLSATGYGENVSGTYYIAGGGGGGAGTTGGLGGSGGGGKGTNGTANNATSGTVNSGSGGGGAGAGNFTTGNGGSGLVILRTSGSYTAQSTTGSPARVESGGFTYYTFTSSGSITI